MFCGKGLRKANFNRAISQTCYYKLSQTVDFQETLWRRLIFRFGMHFSIFLCQSRPMVKLNCYFRDVQNYWTTKLMSLTVSKYFLLLLQNYMSTQSTPSKLNCSSYALNQKGVPILFLFVYSPLHYFYKMTWKMILLRARLLCVIIISTRGPIKTNIYLSRLIQGLHNGA